MTIIGVNIGTEYEYFYNVHWGYVAVNNIYKQFGVDGMSTGCSNRICKI